MNIPLSLCDQSIQNLLTPVYYDSGKSPMSQGHVSSSISSPAMRRLANVDLTGIRLDIVRFAKCMLYM